MYKFASISEDREWDVIRDSMERDINRIRISDTDMKFLENVTILETMQDIGKSFEVLERFNEIATEGFWGDLWDKIKKFFVDLWDKFINFIKAIPNFFRPYMARIANIRDRIGVTLTLKNPVDIMGYDFRVINNRVMAANTWKVILAGNPQVPTLVDANSLPIRTAVSPDVNKLEKVHLGDDQELVQYIGIVITYYNQLEHIMSELNNSFNVVMTEFQNKEQEQGITGTDYAKIVKDFNEDILYISNFAKGMLEAAKNICKIPLENIHK